MGSNPIGLKYKNLFNKKTFRVYRFIKALKKMWFLKASLNNKVKRFKCLIIKEKLL